jgi:hypothetical protein
MSVVPYKSKLKRRVFLLDREMISRCRPHTYEERMGAASDSKFRAAYYKWANQTISRAIPEMQLAEDFSE